VSSTVSLLVALLVLAYLGSALFKRRATRDFGLASGAEYVVLGFLLGPLLGLIGRDLLTTFDGMHRMGGAWLALLAGLGYGVTTRRSVGRATLGVVLTALVGTGVAAASWFIAGYLWKLALYERVLLSLSTALLCCATTHNVSPWFATSHKQHGGVTEALRDLGRASALVPAVVLAFVLAIAPNHGLDMLVPWGRVGVTLGTGVLLGLLGTLLLGSEFRSSESWGLLLGLAVLGAGLGFYVGLSAVACNFCMGLTVSLASRHAHDIRAMISPSEKAVMLPVALLLGASIEPESAPWVLLAALIGGALGARVLSEFLRGFLVFALLKKARAGGPWLGPAMTTTSGFTLAAAVELRHMLPIPLGPALLMLAALGAVLGAVLAPLQLRRVLQRAGELDDSNAPLPLSSDSDLPPLSEGERSSLS
jgi:hypothetical protein